MSANLSTADRLARLLVGTLCLYFGLMPSAVIPSALLSTAIAAFGALNLFAAFSSHCPVYKMCGVSSLRSAAANTPAEK